MEVKQMDNEQLMDWHTMSEESFQELMEYIQRKNWRLLQEINANNNDDMPF